MDVFGLLGNPVEHSLSPPMHHAAYDELGMDARYVTFEPAPDDLGSAIAGARALGIRGLNVTIPFKRDALEHCDPDDLAVRIGAVNTLDFGAGADTRGLADADNRGRANDVVNTGNTRNAGNQGNAENTPTGHNTDAAGVRRAFAHHDVSLAGRAVVVGAGGTGRAAAFALADAGMEVTIANRTVERATDLAAAIESASGHGLDALSDVLADADVLVNATSVGMETDESPVPRSALHADLAVLDAVYSPIKTRLLREAAAAGATTIDGAWMLLYQGVAAFERWTGRDAPVAAMNDALRARI